MEHIANNEAADRRRHIVGLAIVVALILAVACYVYGIQHGSHLAQAMTWLLVLACPLMHLFGHRHRHGGASKSD